MHVPEFVSRLIAQKIISADTTYRCLICWSIEFDAPRISMHVLEKHREAAKKGGGTGAPAGGTESRSESIRR